MRFARRKVRILSELTLVGVALAAAAQARAQELSPSSASAAFAEAAELAAASRGVWSAPLGGALLLADPRTRRAIGSASDDGGVLGVADGVFAGTLPADVPIANTGLDWGGRRWTMLMWPLPAGTLLRRVLLAHEMYHALQPAIGLPGLDAVPSHLEQEEARVWLRLEWRALQRALSASGAARREAIEDALTFRAARRAAYADGAEAERRLEMNEGLAEYTGVRVALGAGARAGWVARALDDHEARALGRSVVRNFAYASGPAYGVLLDGVDESWRTRLRAEDDLGELLGRAYGVAARTHDLADARGARYDDARVRAEERERARAEAERQAAFAQRFQTGPTLTLPVDDRFGYSFDPNDVAAFGEVGSVYAGAQVTAGWGRLQATGRVLMLRRDGLITGVVVPAPTSADGAPVSGDGWTLELADAWRLAPGARTGDWVVVRR